MINIQAVAINKSTSALKDNQVQATLQKLKNQGKQGATSTWSSECSELMLFYYVNNTSKVQIARIANPANWFERVVFPGQRLLFEALPDAELEIHTAVTATTILLDKIKCKCLCISHT